LALFVKIVVLASNKFEQLLIVVDDARLCGRSVLREIPRKCKALRRFLRPPAESEYLLRKSIQVICVNIIEKQQCM
jgi:hypothetical protein